MSPQRSAPNPSSVITIEVLGRVFTGHYSVQGSPAMIRVTSAWGERTTPLGNFPVEPLALQMLREIAAETP